MKQSIHTLAIAVLLAGIMAMPVAFADEAPGITIFPHLGQSYFDDDANLDDDGHVGIGVGYRFDNPWSIELNYREVEAGFETPLLGEADVDSWSLGGLYHLGSRDGIVPFLSLGIGRVDYDTDLYGADHETQISGGLGVKWFIAEKAAVRGDLHAYHGTGDDSVNMAISLGLHLALGGSKSKPVRTVAAAPAEPAPSPAPRDEDGDGIVDNADQCPGTPRGVEVDSYGCPQDDDGDGVYNYMDDCPNTTNRRAKIDARGCYMKLERKVDITLNVQFDIDSHAPRLAHEKEVSKVADFMEQYQTSEVVMEGHTDNQGSESYNQRLSERRAKAIADMLVEKFGISSGRVSYRGFGESRPVATNDTEEGRQRNRRVHAVLEAEKEVIEMK